MTWDAVTTRLNLTVTAAFGTMGQMCEFAFIVLKFGSMILLFVLVLFIWGRSLPPVAPDERSVMGNFIKKLNLLPNVGKPLMAFGFRVLTDL